MLRPINTKPSAPLKNGFTLIELSVVLLVMAMMATSVVPALIAQTRDKLADRVVRDFQHLNSAVLLFRADQDPSRWPGYDENCENLTGGETWFAELEAAGYIPDIDTAPTDPWNGEYGLDIVANCSLRLTSGNTIPASVYTYIENTSSLNTLCNAVDNCTHIVGAGGAGGAADLNAFAGQVSIFDGDANEGECPDGWALYEPLGDGRFPRGVANNNLLLGQTGGTQYLKMQFGYSALDDEEYIANLEEMDDSGVFGELKYINNIGLRALNDEDEEIDGANTWNLQQSAEGNLQELEPEFDITPPYTNVLYCQFLGPAGGE